MVISCRNDVGAGADEYEVLVRGVGSGGNFVNGGRTEARVCSAE